MYVQEEEKTVDCRLRLIGQNMRGEVGACDTLHFCPMEGNFRDRYTLAGAKLQHVSFVHEPLSAIPSEGFWGRPQGTHLTLLGKRENAFTPWVVGLKMILQLSRRVGGSVFSVQSFVHPSNKL